MRYPVILFAPLLLAGCFSSLFALDRKVDGPWRLVETDTSDDRMLCRSAGEDGTGCIVDIDAQVFAAGWDHRYIVAARHPLDDRGRAITTRSEYFYIARSPDEARPTWRAAPRGPFDEQRFARESARLHLPPLTIWP